MIRPQTYCIQAGSQQLDREESETRQETVRNLAGESYELGRDHSRNGLGTARSWTGKPDSGKGVRNWTRKAKGLAGNSQKLDWKQSGS
jgi:hypothetical protein